MKLFKRDRLLEICKASKKNTDGCGHWCKFCQILAVDYIYLYLRRTYQPPMFEHKRFTFQGQQRRFKVYKFLLYWGWNSWDWGYPNKLWIDDIRQPPSEDWQVVRTYEAALAALAANHYKLISLDHDLGQPDGKDGYGIVKWLAERKMDGKRVPDFYKLHTANPVGHENMKATIQRYLM